MPESIGDREFKMPIVGGRTRVAILLANYLSSFTIGIAVGGISPFLSLILEARGVNETIIGANAAVGSVGIICVAPFVPAVVRRFGLATSVVAGILLSVVAFLAMAVTGSLVAWLVLRFVFSGGLAIHWVVSETWMNAVSTHRDRGQILSIYVTAIAAGFATGPVVLGIVGISGWLPFTIFAAGTVASAIPLAMVAQHAPVIETGRTGAPWMLVRRAPTVFAAVVIGGIYGGASFTLLPIYGLRAGLSETDAVFILTMFLAGNVVFQVPIGWLSDRFNHFALLLGCGLVAVLVPLMISSFLADAMLLAIVLAVWGGAVFGFYTIGLTMLGERFVSGDMVTANAAYVMTFEFANMVGPPAAGLAMSLWSPHGMMAMLFCAALIFVCALPLCGRGCD